MMRRALLTESGELEAMESVVAVVPRAMLEEGAVPVALASLLSGVQWRRTDAGKNISGKRARRSRPRGQRSRTRSRRGGSGRQRGHATGVALQTRTSGAVRPTQFNHTTATTTTTTAAAVSASEAAMSSTATRSSLHHTVAFLHTAVSASTGCCTSTRREMGWTTLCCSRRWHRCWATLDRQTTPRPMRIWTAWQCSVGRKGCPP